MPVADPTPMTGSCLCGGIRFCILGPLDAVQVCHCGQCRKAQGGPFATNIPVARSALQWLAGGHLLRRYESSPGKTRLFCTRCGSHIMAERESQPTVLLRLGCLDTPITDKPRAHIWRSQAASWYDPADILPELPEGFQR